MVWLVIICVVDNVFYDLFLPIHLPRAWGIGHDMQLPQWAAASRAKKGAWGSSSPILLTLNPWLRCGPTGSLPEFVSIRN